MCVLCVYVREKVQQEADPSLPVQAALPQPGMVGGGAGEDPRLTHNCDGGGLGQEPPAAAEEEAAPHEEAGSKAGELLEVKLETAEEAALGELNLPENVILSKGENGDEVCPGNRKGEVLHRGQR